MTRSQALPLPSKNKKIRLASPNPSLLPPRREIRLRTWPQPVHLRQLSYPLGSTATLCPPVHFCSRPESSFFYNKEAT
jgi:hypothetical protein